MASYSKARGNDILVILVVVIIIWVVCQFLFFSSGNVLKLLHTPSVHHSNSNMRPQVKNTQASVAWARLQHQQSGHGCLVYPVEGLDKWQVKGSRRGISKGRQNPSQPPKPDTTGTLASYSKPLRHQSLVGIIHGQLISLLPVSTKWFPNLKSSITACTDSCLTLFFVEISRNWKGLFFRFSLQLKAIFQPGLLSQMGE